MEWIENIKNCIISSWHALSFIFGSNKLAIFKQIVRRTFRNLKKYFWPSFLKFRFGVRHFNSHPKVPSKISEISICCIEHYNSMFGYDGQNKYSSFPIVLLVNSDHFRWKTTIINEHHIVNYNCHNRHIWGWFWMKSLKKNVQFEKACKPKNVVTSHMMTE